VHGEYFGDAARGQVGEGEVVAGGALRLGDAAHNIRSALNHFAWAAVRSPNWQTMFCVWGQAARRRRGSGGAPPLSPGGCAEAGTVADRAQSSGQHGWFTRFQFARTGGELDRSR
jgi:hypothetical protein